MEMPSLLGDGFSVFFVATILYILSYKNVIQFFLVIP